MELYPASAEELFEQGQQQVAAVAKEIEAATGETLDSRRVLDFGCGIGRMALPMAERCQYVYGVDIAPSVLREAECNAKRMSVENVEWAEVGKLAELSGKYDLVISFTVFQHIVAQKGEKVLTALVRGLRPGGIGYIQVILRPRHPVLGLFSAKRQSPKNYLYMLVNSYSLNRLGRLLAEEGIIHWRVVFGAAGPPFDSVAIIFQKD